MTALKIIVIILFVIFTVATVQMHPTMHHPLVLENADFKVERLSDNYRQHNMIISNNPAVSSKRIIQAENVAPTEVKTIKTLSPVSQKREETIEQRNIKSPSQEDNTQSQLALLQQLIDQTQQTQSKEPIIPKPAQKTMQTQPKSNANPYMTEQEEIIAWNKWRSDIQNKIMTDSNITADFGTMFLFSFVVDKYGNVSNINTWSLSPNYTPMAKRQIKPAISSLQGQPLLKFPRGTQRTSTIVAGAFTIAFEDRFANPSDYSDYERLR